MGHKKQKSIPNDEIKATQDSSNANQECGTNVVKSVSLSKKSHKDNWIAIKMMIIVQEGLVLLNMGIANYKKEETIVLSLGRASFLLSSTILRVALFVLSFFAALVFTVQYFEPSPFRTVVILMLCINHPYGTFMWMVEASRYIVICNSFKMNGILFISLGALGCILFSLFIMLVFYWRHQSKIKKQGGDQ
ncbi:hypothetical protein P8452_58294 [Trifolium repens]|nr:hypothetical protein P8452_58294 [Trifolium repens]